MRKLQHCLGKNFPRDITEYLEQVASLKKAKAAANPSPSGFYKPYTHRPPNQILSSSETPASTLFTSASPKQSPAEEA